MDKFIIEMLGPYYGVALAFGALVVWWLRTSLRRLHLLIFAGIAALAGTSFYILVLLLMFGGNKVTHASLALFGLHASAAITTAAASAMLLTLVLITWRER